MQVGAGVKAGAVYRVGTQGALTRTDNQYDLAIDGRGYFQVLTPQGDNAYTRAGNLSVNDQGQLVTQDGYQIQPAITIPSDAISVSISKSGQVEVLQAEVDGAGFQAGAKVGDEGHRSGSVRVLPGLGDCRLGRSSATMRKSALAASNTLAVSACGNNDTKVMICGGTRGKSPAQ